MSPLVPRGANISTLRVWTPLVLGYIQTVLIQDYRDASVVTGFSAVGGLWTSLSGIFTLLFGASMLHILYGEIVILIIATEICTSVEMCTLNTPHRREASVYLRHCSFSLPVENDERSVFDSLPKYYSGE